MIRSLDLLITGLLALYNTCQVTCCQFCRRMESVDITDNCFCNSLHTVLGDAVFCSQEKHAKQPTQNLDNFFKDKQSHLYTLGMMFHSG